MSSLLLLPSTDSGLRQHILRSDMCFLLIACMWKVGVDCLKFEIGDVEASDAE